MRVQRWNSQKRAAALLGAVGLLLLGVAHAGTLQAAQPMPWDNALTQIKYSLTGPFAMFASIAGLVVGGAGLIFGAELSAFFKTLFAIVLVISIIVGAPSVIALFQTATIGGTPATGLGLFVVGAL